MTIGQQEIVCLLGPSGAGKTTLLNMLIGTEEADTGTIHRSTDRIGYVFQEDRLLPWLTLFENIRLVDDTRPDEQIYRCLRNVSLNGYENMKPRQMSGGMRQRGAIARALFYGGHLLFLDEPFKSLDEKLRYDMLHLVRRLREQENLSVLFVTHDMDEALCVADRVLILSGQPAGISGTYDLRPYRHDGTIDEADEFRLKRTLRAALYA
ncbi:MAG: ABC transporter ATP-binding protein [Eubacteriales bacterium]|nr:ABC transporter ATP-binding protein [Eubacteriales bacterium]